jgi:predicted metal-dependent hydrolase
VSYRLNQGIFFFNSGRYFEAHEVWEEMWRDEQGNLRLFYQGLVQAAVGLHHFARNNLLGARLQLSKALAKLDLYPAETEGIDLAGLRRDLEAILGSLEKGDKSVFSPPSEGGAGRADKIGTLPTIRRGRGW